MALKDGDVLRFDYTLWVDEKLLDTSIEETASANKIHREGRTYRPLTVTLGSRHIIAGLESHIRSHGQVGRTIKVTIAAKEAYGEREAAKIRDVPMAQFRSQKVKPEVGMSLNMGQERGVVTRVAGGRVRVDLNHELAGKDLTYEYTVREVLTDDGSKVQAIIESMFPQGTYKLHHDEKSVTLEVPDQAKFDENWRMAKFTVVARLREATGKKKEVRLVEVYPVMPDSPQQAAADEAAEPGHEGHNHPPGHKH